MKRLFLSSTLLSLPLFFIACASTEETIRDGIKNSPTGKLVRGEITADEYPNEIKRANEETQALERLNYNREPSRAYNIRSEKIEYVPEDTEQYWNESKQRWEFVPLEQ